MDFDAPQVIYFNVHVPAPHGENSPAVATGWKPSRPSGPRPAQLLVLVAAGITGSIPRRGNWMNFAILLRFLGGAAEASAQRTPGRPLAHYQCLSRRLMRRLSKRVDALHQIADHPGFPSSGSCGVGQARCAPPIDAPPARDVPPTVCCRGLNVMQHHDPAPICGCSIQR